MISSDVNILVIGDPHFKVAGVPEHDKMCKSIIEKAKNKKIDLIVILGDILDRFETIHVSPLTRSIKFLGELIKIAPIYVLIGNHDLKNNKQFLSEEHGFSSFKLLNELHTENINNIIKTISDIISPDENLDIMNKIAENITKLNKITFVDKVMSTNINNQKFIFMPYVPTGRFQEALDTLEIPSFDDVSCIFAHQEFKGAQMGAITSVDGDIWSVNNSYIISGHIHDHQNLQENILYIGTPIQHSFGDNPNKTISYFNFKSSSQRTEERISLGLLRKSTVRISCDEVNKYIPPVNSILRINIIGNHEALKSIMRHPNVIKWEKLGHKIFPKDIPIIDSDSIIKTAHLQPPKFSIALQKSISNDPKLQELYFSIFGKKQQEIKEEIKIKKPLKLIIVK
jgi:DNA repair exonuclease SbcCD nuclease subunit